MTFSGELVYNDAAHTYTLDGSRCKSVTAVAKIPVDTYNVELWSKRMVAIGMTLDPDLIEQVAANLENKDIINKVCDSAAETAKAHLKANRGSQMHRATEFVDLGQDDRLLTDQQKRDAAAWRRTLERYGIEPLPGFVEGFVVYPAQNVAGRFDRVATIGAEGGVTAILDLKSGENAVTYPQSTAVQLGLYANAPHVSASVRVIGDRTTVTGWQTMPAELDRRYGYVVYLPPDADVGELWRIDIDHGMAGAGYALSLVQWRKAHDYGKRLSSKIAAPVPHAADEPRTATAEGEERAPSAGRRKDSASVPTAMVARDADKTASAASGGAADRKPAAGNPSPTTGGLAVDRRKALLARFMDLSDDDQARFRALGVDRDDLDAVEKALDSIDPFAQQQASAAALSPSAPAAAPPSLPTAPDEGREVDDGVFDALEPLFLSLGDRQRAWVQTVIHEASQAGVPFIANRSTGKRTVRRFELYRALMFLGYADLGEDELVRGLVATVLESDAPWFPTFTLGHVVGSLGVTDAEHFAQLCRAAAEQPETIEFRSRPVAV